MRTVLLLLGAHLLVIQPLQAQAAVPAPGDPTHTQVAVAQAATAVTASQTDAIKTAQQDNSDLRSAIARADLASQNAQQNRQDLLNYIRASEQRFAALEKQQTDAFNSRVDIAKKKYKLGREVLESMIKGLGSLSFATQYAATVGALEQSSNPTNINSVQSTLSTVETALGKSQDGNNQLQPSPSWLANPWLAAAYSVTALFSARFGNHDQNAKRTKFESLMCSLQFTTATAADARALALDNERLSARSDSLGAMLRTHFATYVQLVGTTTTYDAFVADGNVETKNEIATEAEFNKLLIAAGNPPPATEPDLLLQEQAALSQVYQDLLAYEAVGQDMRAQLATIYNTARRDSVQVSDAVAHHTCDALTDFAPLLTNEAVSAHKASENFNNAWNGFVSPIHVRDLFTTL